MQLVKQWGATLWRRFCSIIPSWPMAHHNDSSQMWDILSNQPPPAENRPANNSKNSQEKDLISFTETDRAGTEAGGNGVAFQSSAENRKPDRASTATGASKPEENRMGSMTSEIRATTESRQEMKDRTTGDSKVVGQSRMGEENRETSENKMRADEGRVSPGEKRAAEQNKASGSRESPQSSSPKRRPVQIESERLVGAGTGFQSDDWGKKIQTIPINCLKKEPDCHMELDDLRPNGKHTVLIDITQFHRRIVPYTGRHFWDKDHVKLPILLPKAEFSEPRWKAMQKALHDLTKGNAAVGDVAYAIQSYNKAHREEWSFDSLSSYLMHVPRQDNYFPAVIAKMAKLALQLPNLIKHAIPLLQQGRSHAITMSQEQISSLLANAFFCTFPHRNISKPGSEYANYPSINFSQLFGDSSMRKIQKLRGLFHYFKTVTEQETKPDGLVTFERICIPTSELPDWKTKKEPLTQLHVSPEGSIEEEGKGMLQVDFASKYIGGGVLGRGLVQEEIRFIMCPELIVARLFTEKLADNECLRITGVQRFNSCSGYSDSFQWLGPYEDKSKKDKWKRRYCQIVAIDALKFDKPHDQYTKHNINRELNKAYVGFKGDNNIPSEYTPAIATGNWGCGAFHGDARLKALIQMMAAAVAQRDLAFFTFGNKSQACEVQHMHDLLMEKRVTVGQLYGVLVKYCDHYSRKQHKAMNVFEFVIKEMGYPHKL